ncbi:hypothetical protein [Flavobacterium chilense]|uniref:Lipid A biosynthesis acyltransferase n=1 Tax=Flavobacterium chilense TaxID=946677 RepID=A0A1M7MY22_9FLAO|nr:hypothetical protein [Flavobacterium chilense]SHM95567.1 lipid A biosynthesis acyltransferase [Flavobacterium chilense]
MINNYRDYAEYVEKLRHDVSTNDILSSYKENPFVSVKTEADQFFTNLNGHNILAADSAFDRQTSFFKDVVFYQLINQLDTQCNYKLFTDELITIRNTEFIPKTGLFCSFHYGAFIQIPAILKILNIDFVILSMAIDSNDVVNWETKNKTENETKEKIDQPVSISPFEKESIFKIFKYLKKGVSVLIYIDGIQGNIDQQDKRVKKIDFFNQQLVLSSGIMEISQKLKIPVVPVIAERKEDYRIEAVFHNLENKEDFGNENYAQNAIQKTVDILTGYLKNQPAQWQEWTHIHQKMIYKSPKKNIGSVFFARFLKRVRPSTYDKKPLAQSLLKFNNEEYEIVDINHESYIVCIRNYVSFKITDKLRQILLSLEKSEAKIMDLNQFVPASLLKDLLHNKIIVSR